MTSYRDRGIRPRTMHYSDGSETDYVCTACLTIVLDRSKGCQHCRRAEEQRNAKKEAQTFEWKWKARLAPKLKGQQQAIEMSEAGELQLF